MSKDYERQPKTSEVLVYLTMIRFFHLAIATQPSGTGSRAIGPEHEAA